MATRNIPIPSYQCDLVTLNRGAVNRFFSTKLGLDLMVFKANGKAGWAPNLFDAKTWLPGRTSNYLLKRSVFTKERRRLERGSDKTVQRWKATVGAIPPNHAQHLLCLLLRGKLIGTIDQCSATHYEVLADQPFQERKVCKRLSDSINTSWSHRCDALKRVAWLLYDMAGSSCGPRPSEVDAREIHHLLNPPERFREVRDSQPELVRWLTYPKNTAFVFEGRSIFSWIAGATSSHLFKRNRFTKRAAASLAERSSRIVRMGMRLVTTDSCDFGWATNLTTVGDKVFLVEGCSVPVVLRERQGGGYHVVGDSIIYGLMNGQGMDSSGEGWGLVMLE